MTADRRLRQHRATLGLNALDPAASPLALHGGMAGSLAYAISPGGRWLVIGLHMSKNWGDYSQRKPLFDNLLDWPPPTSPKFDLPTQNAA